MSRTSTCHHCGKKGHIRPHCKKLNSLPKTRQWRKNFSPPKTTPIWVRKADLLLTLCWMLKLHKCGWLHIKSSDQGGQAPTPNAATKIHSGGAEIEGELLHPDWQKLHDDFCLSIMDKYRGRRMKPERALQAKAIQDLKSSSKGHTRSTVLIFFVFKIQCILGFSFG